MARVNLSNDLSVIVRTFDETYNPRRPVPRSRCLSKCLSRSTWSPSPGLGLACRSAFVRCAPSSRYQCPSRCRGFRERWFCCSVPSGWTQRTRLSSAIARCCR